MIGPRPRYRLQHVRIHFPRAGALIDAELAMTPEDRRQGLAERSAATPFLFLFEKADRWAMTMHGMRVPLDMLFLDDRKEIVETLSRIPPTWTDTIVPHYPVRYVLELPSGKTQELGLRAGDRALIVPLLRR